MPVEIDFDRAVFIIGTTLATQRTAGAVPGSVAGEGLFVTTVIRLDPLVYLFHPFAGRTAIAVGDGVIDKLISSIRLALPFPMPLVPVELIVLYIGSNSFFFQPLIVLLTPIAGISRYIVGFPTVVADMSLQVRDQCSGIGRVLVKTVRGDKLIVGADLYIIAWL